MKASLLFLSLFLAAPAFAADLSPELKAALIKLDENCAGNDNGSITRFDPKKFNARKASREMKEETGCGRIYSKSRTEGVDGLLETLFNRHSEDAKCAAEYLSAGELGLLKEFIQDPTHLGVFFDVWNGEGESETCTYSNFAIYTAGGTLVKIVFNHTD